VDSEWVEERYTCKCCRLGVGEGRGGDRLWSGVFKWEIGEKVPAKECVEGFLDVEIFLSLRRALEYVDLGVGWGGENVF
jgi:hypothetical protein